MRKLSTHDPAPEVRSSQSIAGWSIAAALLAGYVAMLQRYAINFPSADDFSQLLAVPHYVSLAGTFLEKLKVVIGLSPEHRIATLRLAALIQAHWLGGINFLALMYFASALLVLAAGLIVGTVEREVRPMFTAFAAALLLSPANYENTLWASGALTHYAALGYAFSALYCLSRLRAGWQIAAGLLALAAAGTSAAGLMLFPSAVLLLCLARRWRSALVWAIAGAILFSVYFIGYEAPPYQVSLTAYLRDPWVPLRFFLITVGSLGLVPSVAFAIGLGLSAYWLWLIASGRIRSLPPVIVALVAFMLLSIAAITWGRVGFGDAGALVVRYRVYSELVVVITLAAVLVRLAPLRAVRLLTVALPLGLAFFAANWWYNLRGMEQFASDHRHEYDYYVTHGKSPADLIPPGPFRDFMLSSAKLQGFYDPVGTARPAPGHSTQTADKR